MPSPKVLNEKMLTSIYIFNSQLQRFFLSQSWPILVNLKTEEEFPLMSQLWDINVYLSNFDKAQVRILIYSTGP